MLPAKRSLLTWCTLTYHISSAALNEFSEVGGQICHWEKPCKHETKVCCYVL